MAWTRDFQPSIRFSRAFPLCRSGHAFCQSSSFHRYNTTASPASFGLLFKIACLVENCNAESPSSLIGLGLTRRIRDEDLCPCGRFVPGCVYFRPNRSADLCSGCRYHRIFLFPVLNLLFSKTASPNLRLAVKLAGVTVLTLSAYAVTRTFSPT